MQSVENGTGDVRRLADAQWAAAQLVESYAGLPEGISKAMLLDRFERAAPRLGLHESLVRFVRALVRVTQEQDWTGDGFRPIAWPSNDALGEELQRSRTEIQRLTRAAVRAGLLHMKDSGNGKRYGFRGDRGEIVEAYGFDLSPLAVRWDEFADIAAARGIEQARRRHLRQKVSEIRREIRTVCADALERDYRGYDWPTAIAKASGRLPRSPTLPDLESLQALYLGLLTEVDAAWLQAREAMDSEPRGVSDGAQKEPTNEPRAERATYSTWREGVVADRPSSDPGTGGGRPGGPFDEEVIPLSLVLDAVPEMHAHIGDPAAADWEELVAGAYQVTALLGINLSAWREARDTMGRNRAAIAVATILARWLGGEVKSAGGYLRAMCERERTGDLHLMPSLYGLKERHHPKPKKGSRT